MVIKETTSEKLKAILRPAYQNATALWRFVSFKLRGSNIKNAKDIPIIINNRNRLLFLEQLIASLEKRGYLNIHIIDNNSDFPPLVEFYKNCKHKVYLLGKNVGHLSLWKTDLHKKFINDYYVYTDSDVVLIDECPEDFMQLFINEMEKNIWVQKIGFSLKLDDLPDFYNKKQEVLNWEKQFYERKRGDLFYKANVDTTFALYRPGMKANKGHLMYRSAYPYQARHMPWYVDSENLSYEENYYITNAARSTHWT